MTVQETLLGLPVRDRGALLASTAIVLAVFLSTMSRSIGLFDGGELAVAAVELGLGHPPGQPLHAMLGFVFSHLPGTSPAVGLAALSAIPAAFSIVPTWVLATSFAPSPAHRLVVPVSLLSAALHGLSWEPATRIEVYPLAVFFGLMAVARYATLAAARDERRASLVGGLYLGLSACANPVVAVIAACSALSMLAAPRRGLAVRLGASFVGGCIGLLPYLHLVFVAGRQDAFVWGGLGTTDEVVHFLTGRDFARNLAAPLGTRLSQTLSLLDYLASERAAIVTMVAGLLGAGVALRQRRASASIALVLSLVLTLGLVASNVVFSVDVPDYLGYLALPFALLAAASVAALDAAIRRTPAGWLLGAAMIAATVLSMPVAWQRTRATDDVCMRVAEAILAEAPNGAIVVVDSDHLAGPLLYAQRVERIRTDVVVVIRGLMSSRWYVELLERQYADLRPYAVVGEGGRDGRVRRLLAANADRSVRLEHLDLAVALRRSACAGGITLRTGADCEGDVSPRLARLVELADHTWRLPEGAVEGRMILPAVTYRVGIDLYRLGLPREAYAVLLLGLTPNYRRSTLPPRTSILEHDRLMQADFPFRRTRAIGEPARNAFVAATLLARAGEVDAAVELLTRAAADGLPEAEELLRRSSR